MSTSMNIPLSSNIFALLEGEDNDDVQQIIVKHTAPSSVKKKNNVEKVNKVKPAPLPAAASKLKKSEHQPPQRVQRSRLQQQKAVEMQKSPDNLKGMVDNVRGGLNGKFITNINGLGKDDKEKEVESVVMTLKEYENKRRAVEAEKKTKKTEERKVNIDKDFESMRLVCKKEQEDGLTINSAAKNTKKGRRRKTSQN